MNVKLAQMARLEGLKARTCGRSGVRPLPPASYFPNIHSQIPCVVAQYTHLAPSTQAIRSAWSQIQRSQQAVPTMDLHEAAPPDPHAGYGLVISTL